MTDGGLMRAYLIDHPPLRDQWRNPRRATPTGLVVVHTAESHPDETGPDDGAENVARFIASRDTPGSYHLLADSDSWLLVVPLPYEAYGDGTGSNPYAVHVSVATTAARWPTLPAAWRDGAVDQLAAATAHAIAWLKATHGITVPIRRVTRAASERGEAGFISHAERDPRRRSDPGPGFPWATYFARLRVLLEGGDGMATEKPVLDQLKRIEDRSRLAAAYAKTARLAVPRLEAKLDALLADALDVSADELAATVATAVNAGLEDAVRRGVEASGVSGDIDYEALARAILTVAAED